MVGNVADRKNISDGCRVATEKYFRRHIGENARLFSLLHMHEFSDRKLLGAFTIKARVSKRLTGVS